jgi:hypothetical protein
MIGACSRAIVAPVTPSRGATCRRERPLIGRWGLSGGRANGERGAVGQGWHMADNLLDNGWAIGDPGATVQLTTG